MVLLAASIFSKDGRNLLSRQFVDITRARIESLLTAFPKLIASGKQHTFVETESVRYVYQPLDKLFIMLLTTKASNILEDLATLRLFSKVIPEYSRSLDECDIKESIFEIIFAFDEIVALGYRENVDLAQIKTFTDMESVDEKAFLAVRGIKEKGAIENMKRKVREIEATRDNNLGGSYRPSCTSTGFGNSIYSLGETIPSFIAEENVVVNKLIVPIKIGSGKSMRLGVKNNIIDAFLEQLTTEGVNIEHSDELWQSHLPGGSSTRSHINDILVQEQVHVRIEEKLKIELNHCAGLTNMELFGILLLRISNEANNMIRLKVDLGEGIQLQTHPNVDKKMFQTSNILQPKSPNKSFPIGQEIGLLKWRCQSQEDEHMPLLINCWPTKTNHGCSVNIEFELQNQSLELHNVVISIPLPTGTKNPTVVDVTGEYSIDANRTHLLWTLPVVDDTNDSGSLEFLTETGKVEDFFPLTVNFCSDNTLTGMKMVNAFDQSGNRVSFSVETFILVDKYEIL